MSGWYAEMRGLTANWYGAQPYDGCIRRRNRCVLICLSALHRRLYNVITYYIDRHWCQSKQQDGKDELKVETTNGVDP